MADARFAYELRCGELEDTAHSSFELPRGETGDRCEIRGAQFLIEVPLNMRDHPAHTCELDILCAGRGKIAGDGSEAYHLPSGIVERHFGRQIPAYRAIRIRDQLQPIDHFLAGLKDMRVLLPVDLRELGGKKIFRHFPDDLRGGILASAGGKGGIRGAVTVLRVLHAEEHVRQMVEKLLAEPRRGHFPEKIHIRRHYVQEFMPCASYSVKTAVLS